MRWYGWFAAACTPVVDDLDGDGFPVGEDCADTDAAIHPGAVERCDGLAVDEDCDGRVDAEDPDAVTVAVYLDTDSDGFGAGPELRVCTLQSGYALAPGDCDDTRAQSNPGGLEVCDPADLDEDCDGAADDVDAEADGKVARWPDVDDDGWGDPERPAFFCDPPADYLLDANDCDDGDANVHPDAPEFCDGVDDDCDERVDDEPVDGAVFYADGDADTWGDVAQPVVACELPPGAAYDGTDCDDTSAAVNPGATEVCDPLDKDEDCDFLADDLDPGASATTMTTFWPDADGDTFGSQIGSVKRCDVPVTYTADTSDCDDARADVSPNGLEVCDPLNVDEDCDLKVDDADPSVDPSSYPVWYTDSDRDEWGGAVYVGPGACGAAIGRTAKSGDCADDNAAIHPSAAEVCDAADTDEDCDALVDDADPTVGAAGKVEFTPDADGDTYGDEFGVPVLACDTLAGYGPATDCDDAFADAFPGAPEECLDPIDHNCDGVVQCAYSEADGLPLAVPGDVPLAARWAGDLDGDGRSEIAATVDGNDLFSLLTPDGIELTRITVRGGQGSAAPIPDHDGDGVGEVAWAAFNGNYNAGSGAVFIMPGSTRGTITADTALDYYYGTDHFGWSVSPTGDVDGDGVNELWITSGAGLYLVPDDPSGPTNVAGLGTFVAQDPSNTWALMYGCAIGDTDGEGIADLAAGSVATDELYVWTSPPVDGTDLSSADLSYRPDPTMLGFGNDCFGGDFDGDGYADLAAGAPLLGPGQVYVWPGPLAAGAPPVATFSGAAGSYAGERGSGSAGDVNGDGADDLALGFGFTVGLSYGEVWLFSGPVSGALSSAQAEVLIRSTIANQHLGQGTDLRGDMDEDGLADLLTDGTHFISKTKSLYLFPATTLTVP